MEFFANVGLGMIGFLIGNLLFSSVGHWIVAIYEAARERSGGAKGATLPLVTLLHSGPWALIVASVFAYYIRSESWAPPIFLGAAIAIAFFSLITIYMARKAKRTGNDAA